MIIKGRLTAIGEGQTTSWFTAVSHFGFDDRADFRIDDTHRIVIPSRLHSRLSSCLGEHVELSVTDNARLVLAVREDDGRVTKFDHPASSVCRDIYRGVWPSILSGLLLFPGFAFLPPVTLIIWGVWRHKVNARLRATAAAFDQM